MCVFGTIKRDKDAPSSAFSTSTFEGRGLFLSKVKVDITNPGVQKPHCRPWDSIRLFYNENTTRICIFQVIS